MKRKQIRLNWASHIAHSIDVIEFSDEWQSATAESLKTMDIVVEAANAIYGPGTHWSEIREVGEP